MLSYLEHKIQTHTTVVLISRKSYIFIISTHSIVHSDILARAGDKDLNDSQMRHPFLQHSGVDVVF